MSDEDWIVPETPAYVLCNPPEKGSATKGLLWGQGDPKLAHLHSYDYWAVVRVQSYCETENEGRRCVEFKEGETVFEGARTEAINILINLGADPARISVEAQTRDDPVKFRDGPYVRTGDCGTSIVPDYGTARAGQPGHAAAGEEGIAWAGLGGNARDIIFNSETDECERPIACGVVGRDGIQPWVQYTVRGGVLVRVKEEDDE